MAWAVASALCGGGQVSGAYKDLLVEFAALVGLATIADVVPLVGENRVLVSYGLRQLGRTKLAGLRAAMAAAGYAEKAGGLHGGGVWGWRPRLRCGGADGSCAALAVEALLTTAGSGAGGGDCGLFGVAE